MPESSDSSKYLFGYDRKTVQSLREVEAIKDCSTNKFEPFYFIQAADTQFGLIERYLLKLPNPGWQAEIELSEKLIDACNRLEPKPEFMVICGDLIDAKPGFENRPGQIKDLRRVYSRLNKEIPIVCVCGNHDIGDEPTLDNVEEYKRVFGDDYFYFVIKNILFIVINSQFYQHREFVQDYAKEQDEWLENILMKCSSFKYSVVFEHIPWFTKDLDEDNDYFNIPRNARWHWLRKFNVAGVTKVFCGHWHRNSTGWYGDVEVVVTSAVGAQLGGDKSGVRLVKVLEDMIEHQYYAIEDIPEEVKF